MAEFDNAALRAMVDELREDAGICAGSGLEYELTDKAADAIQYLLDECETLRKDAKRYQWLRDKSESLHSFYLSTPIWMTGVRFRQEDVDRSIDAAMTEGKGHV